VTLDAVVIGAGPAGLASSRELTRRGVSHTVLERGERLAHSWRHVYDSLVLHTGRHLSTIPGRSFPRGTPLFPTRDDLVTYLEHYAAHFRLPIQTSAEVISVDRDGGEWVTRTRSGDRLRSRTVVVASGIAANPYVPDFPGRELFRGRVRHSVEYRRPSDVTGRRVLVVGAGNSAGEIASELAGAGLAVTLSVRSGATVLPLKILGLPAQYIGLPFGYLPFAVQRVIIHLGSRLAGSPRTHVLPPPGPKECPNVPLVGLNLVEAIRAGSIRVKPGIAAFGPDAVTFADGSTEPVDDVILATGFRAAIGFMNGCIRLDRCGFGRRSRRVISDDQPNLYFVGHNPDARGGLFSLSRDARRVGRLVAQARS
jgi:cation diffusion facilitator CzcD-associated flavoprotein CzcO